MFDSTTLIIAAVTRRLVGRYRRVFGRREPDHAGAIATAARLALERIGTSDAPYHDLDHTVMVTLLGTDILRGREIAEVVTPEDWLHTAVERLGYGSPADLVEGYPRFFWERIEPYVGDGLRYLALTPEGRQWTANLYAHVFAVEHVRWRMGPQSAGPHPPGPPGGPPGPRG